MQPLGATMSPSGERRIILLLAATQFVNILDFMIVMPLGPDFAVALDIPLAHLGIIGGSYTLAAAVSGLAGAFFLDRFDRRPALAVALLGLAVGTVGAALATGLPTLLLARVVAGAFGGPATSLAMSILADVIPSERRGRALGTVMLAFSTASVLGVPVGLELAHWGTWHTPFIATGALAALAALAAWTVLPPMRGHLTREVEAAAPAFARLLTKPVTLLSYSVTWLSTMGAFVLIPNIAAFVQGNLHYPREHLSWLYGAGGVVSFATLRPIGRLVDRVGSFRVGSAGVVLLTAVTWVGFVRADPRIPVIGVFVVFMLANGMRNVAYNALTSRVPAPEERARFMSLQSMIQHLGCAAGAFLSSQMLSERDGRLIDMDHVAWTSIGLLLALPPMLYLVEKRVVVTERARREDARAPPTDAGAEGPAVVAGGR